MAQLANRGDAGTGIGPMAALGLTAVVVLGGQLAIAVVSARPGRAQSEAATRPKFDVASVKVHPDDRVSPRDPRSAYGPQGVEFDERPLAFLIAEAYNVNGGLIVGPRSLTRPALWGPLTEGYDMVAKTEHRVSKPELRLMLQSLLAERFQLKLHRETKSGPVYELRVAPGGPHLEEGDGGNLVMTPGRNGLVFRNAEISRLCGYLSSYLDPMVIDGTGLQGLYNFTVEIPEELRQRPPVKSEEGSAGSPRASIFADLLKPLGLQLVVRTAPVEYLVVDSVGRLVEN